MKFFPTKLEGCFIIEPDIIADERGYFMESFNEVKFQQNTGVTIHFVQDNQSFSTRGVLRGLHYQTGKNSQAKLVRVLSGKVMDVAVDIRPESNTFGQHLSLLLSSEKQNQIFIPKGFAHGFLVLSETATLYYKCDNFYDKDSEGGILYSDPVLNINWDMEAEYLVVSDKDKMQPDFKHAKPIW